MANELNSLMAVGITAPTAKVFAKGWVQQGATTVLTEVTSGMYTGDFDMSILADDIYYVLFYDGTDIEATGEFQVKDGVEVLVASSNNLIEIDLRTKFIASEVRD